MAFNLLFTTLALRHVYTETNTPYVDLQCARIYAYASHTLWKWGLKKRERERDQPTRSRNFKFSNPDSPVASMLQR